VCRSLGKVTRQRLASTLFPDSRAAFTSPHTSGAATQPARSLNAFLAPIMGHEESFCGDVLRLTSFLRVVEYIPERPARFGRRRQLDVRTEADNAPPNRPEQPTDISLNNNKLKNSAVQHVSPPLITNDSQPQREVLPNHVSEPPQKTYRCSSLNSVKNSRHLTLLSKDTIERGNVAAQKYVPSGLSPKRKKLIVYKAKKCKIDHRDKSFPTTRKRRLININKLALVRTTTSDGLPNRSVGDFETYVTAVLLITLKAG
jgi:hypothetical protein